MVPRNGSQVGPTCGDPDQKVSGTRDIGLRDVVSLMGGLNALPHQSEGQSSSSRGVGGCMYECRGEG